MHENNSLHATMISVKEDAEFSNTRWKAQLSSADHEKSDLKFALTQKDERTRKIQEEVNDLAFLTPPPTSVSYLPPPPHSLELFVEG